MRARKRAMIEAHTRLRAQFPGLLTLIAPRHPERGAAVTAQARRRRADGARCARAANCRRRRPTSTSPTRSASSASSIAWRRWCSSAARWCGTAGRIRSRPAKLGAAILHGPHVWNFAEIYAALDAAHGAERVERRGPPHRRRSAALMTQPAARHSVADNAHATVDGLSGALERTLHAHRALSHAAAAAAVRHA